MKTIPVDNILPLTHPNVVPYLDVYYEAISELVCFGTHILAWTLEQDKNTVPLPDETKLAVPLLFRHILELIDGISVQVKSGITVPCKVQLRAIIEAYMGLEYLLQKDRDRRSKSLLITDHYRKLNYYKLLVPGSKENELFNKELKKDDLDLFSVNNIEHSKANLRVKNQETLVMNPIYDEVRNEYLKKTKNNTAILNLKWYSLFGGPENVKELSRRIEKFYLHEFFYKSWSNQTHGTDLITNTLARDVNGKGAIKQIRNIQEAYDIVVQTITFSRLVFSLMSRKVVSDHSSEIRTWQLMFKKEHADRVDKFKLIVANN